MIVVDASAVVEVLVLPNDSPKVVERLLDPKQRLHAPHLLDIEATQVLRRFVRRGEISAELADSILADLMALPLHRHSHEYLLPRVWELRDNLSAYDAAYVALAELLEAPLVTCDARLAAAPGHRARIELI